MSTSEKVIRKGYIPPIPVKGTVADEIKIPVRKPVTNPSPA
jgi:hypothetical protein